MSEDPCQTFGWRSIPPRPRSSGPTVVSPNRSEPQRVLENTSKMPGPKQAEIEVARLRIGDQVEAEWLPLLGVVYGHKSDVAEIALEGLEHLIQKLREIWMDEDGGALSNLAIVDADGGRQIIKLRDPLVMPAPR